MTSQLCAAYVRIHMYIPSVRRHKATARCEDRFCGRMCGYELFSRGGRVDLSRNKNNNDKPNKTSGGYLRLLNMEFGMDDFVVVGVSDDDVSDSTSSWSCGCCASC